MDRLETILDGFAKTRFTADEITRNAREILGQKLRYRERRINRAYFLAWNEYLGLGYTRDADSLVALSELTPETVNTVVKKYFKPFDKWVISVVTREKQHDNSP